MEVARASQLPGWHQRARFTVSEHADRYRIHYCGAGAEVTVAAHRAEQVMAGSVFGTVDEASAFFQGAPVGYAATPAAGVFDGVELTTDRWQMAPLQLDEVSSSLFHGPAFVPDSAFLMAGIATTWCPQPDLVAAR